MTAYVALLRAVNLAGRNLVTMAALRGVAEECGLTNAVTLLQSGNLVFESKARSPAGLEKLLEKALLEALGIETPVLVRSGSEWAALVAANPFPDEARKDPSHLLAMPLKAKPLPTSLAELNRAIVGREQARVQGRELYLVYPDGIGRSRLTSSLIEKKIGKVGTARNWNTVLKLLALLEAQ